MRWAKSYSIVDHGLLHGGYFQKLSHEALSLYLFLIVVGDLNGRSFYADPTIEAILHFSGDQLPRARESLVCLGLIDYRQPYWWVQSIPPQKTQKTSQGKSHERSQSKNPISQRCPGPLLSPDPGPIGHLAQESLKTIRQLFSQGSSDE